MKSILAFVGSPRNGGNCDILVHHAVQAAKETGAAAEIYYLNEMNYRGCQGCNGCKRGDACVLKDDLTPLYEKIHAADAVVVASPVYFGEVSGQTKSFLDRWYAFLTEGYEKRLKPGKKGLVILAYEMEKEGAYDRVLERYFGELKFMGLTEVSGFAVAGVRDKGDVLARPEALEKAARFGRELANH